MRWRDSEKIGRLKIKIRNPFARRAEPKEANKHADENDIEQDTGRIAFVQQERSEKPEPEKAKRGTRLKFPKFSSNSNKAEKSKGKQVADDGEEIKSRNPLERFAFSLLSSRLSGLEDFRETYSQSGIPVIFEAYVSTGFLLGIIAAIPTLVVSLLLELRLLPRAGLPLSLVGSGILAAVVFGITLVVWLYYPVMRRRSFKSKLENQLAYSFGILGVLAAAGMNLDRLFERIATSESNPVLADLARRFLRNVRVFGLDTETALMEVASHSPSESFSKMLESIGVAQKTTGSIHDLVMFESARLLQDKKDKLRKAIGSLGVMAELYITLVVVGPIIFVVMLAIFSILRTKGNLPDPIMLINILVFVGIPALSVMFVLLLDSVVSKA